MMQVIYQIGNTTVEPPENQAEFAIELNHDPDDPQAVQVSTTNAWVFVKDGAKIINQHIERGKTGGVGILEGIPFKVTITDNGASLVVLDGYIDTGDPDNLYECDRVEVVSKLRGKLDWLDDNTNNVMFNILLSNGTISIDDYVQIPYVISSIPDYQATAIATLTGYAVITQVINIGKELSKVVGGMVSGLGIIGAVIKAFVVILWAIVVLVLVIEVIIGIKNTLIQPIKYHAGMRWQTLLEAGAKFLDKKFSSTIFDNKDYKDTVIIPAKFETIEDLKINDVRGFTTPSTQSNGYYQDSYRDLLLASKDIINGKFTVINDTIHMERHDANPTDATVTLPDVPLEEVGYNTDEFVSNYQIKFRDDLSEQNTLAFYKGTISQTVTSPRRIENSDMVLMKGLETVEIPFALAKRKRELTRIEKKLSKLFKEYEKEVNNLIDTLNEIVELRNVAVKIINNIISVLGLIGIHLQFFPLPLPPIKYVSAGTIDNRIGMMLLSNDFFEQTKIGSFDIDDDPLQTKVKPNNDIIWSAGELYDQFHFINSWVPSNEKPNANQWKRHSIEEFTLCFEDVVKLINNNHIFTSDKRVAKIETLTWNPFTQLASTNFRINELFTTNLEDETIIPDGF